MNYEGVTRFLLEGMGYLKLDELMDDSQNRTPYLKKFFVNTVFATHIPSGKVMTTDNSPQLTPPYAPRIETINSIVSKNEGIRRHNALGEEIILIGTESGANLYIERKLFDTGLPYLVTSNRFFYHQTRRQAEQFINQIKDDFFPDAKPAAEVKNATLRLKLEDEGFYMHVLGGRKFTL